MSKVQIPEKYFLAFNQQPFKRSRYTPYRHTKRETLRPGPWSKILSLAFIASLVAWAGFQATSLAFSYTAATHKAAKTIEMERALQTKPELRFAAPPDNGPSKLDV